MTTLAGAAIGVLRFVGRWVLSELSARGRWRVVRYFSRKIRKFKRRAKQRAGQGRKLFAQWNLARATRWTAAKRWIQRNWFRLAKKAIGALDGEIRSRVPAYVRCEDYSGWIRDLRRDAP